MGNQKILSMTVAEDGDMSFVGEPRYIDLVNKSLKTENPFISFSIN